VVLLAWYVATARGLVNPTLLPSPGEVLDTFWEMARSGELLQHIVISLQRILVGFGAGLSTAVPMGLLIGRVRLVRDFIEPILDTIRPVPALAFLPLAILWFGIGEASKIFLLWFGTFFVIIISVIEGVYNLDVVLLRVARNLDASEPQIFLHVLLPGILPFILEGMRQAIATAFRVIVAAEMIASQTGIGFLILHSSLFYRSDRVFVGIITLGVLGMTADKFISYLTRHFFLRYRRHEEVSI
jgi:NitT/TauT family transport system permease protein